jgi:hypothetical protein
MPIAADPNIAVAATDPVGSDPNGVRVRSNNVVTADPYPTAADPDAPITRGPDVLGTRGNGYDLDLRCWGSLGYHRSIRRRCSWWRRCLRSNRRCGGIRYLRGGSLIWGLRLISIAGRGLIDWSGLISRDIFDSPLGAASGQGGANGRKGQ